MVTALDSLLVESPGVCGGRLRIDGTRITIHRIAAMANAGMSASRIADEYEHLELSQIHAALACYYANRDVIDAELADDTAAYEQMKSGSGAP